MRHLQKITSIGFGGLFQLVNELFHFRKMASNRLFQEMEQGRVVYRLGINKLNAKRLLTQSMRWLQKAHLVDTANTETERTTLQTSTVHIISDQENKLEIKKIEQRSR